jgi:hypothetical protein
MATKEPFGLVTAASPSLNRENLVNGVASTIHKSADAMQEAATVACDSRDSNLVWQLVNTERMLRRLASNLQRQYK